MDCFLCRDVVLALVFIVLAISLLLLWGWIILPRVFAKKKEVTDSWLDEKDPWLDGVSTKTEPMFSGDPEKLTQAEISELIASQFDGDEDDED